jgi:hypothetical protein
VFIFFCLPPTFLSIFKIICNSFLPKKK